MKKLITLILASLMLISVMAGCGTTVPNATESTSATEETKEETTYSDSLESLAEYMKDQGYIAATENAYEMQAQLIGAEKGYRYLNGAIQIELYSYNPDKLNKTAKDVVEQIKENNEFELYGKKIKGFLTDNGKYMMVYTDSAIAEGDTTSDAYKTMEKAVKELNKFAEKYSVVLLENKDTEETKDNKTKES
ncbi:MAG: hypothetical protein ACI4RM_01855 [Ruminococcus sp.]